MTFATQASYKANNVYKSVFIKIFWLDLKNIVKIVKLTQLSLDPNIGMVTISNINLF